MGGGSDGSDIAGGYSAVEAPPALCSPMKLIQYKDCTFLFIIFTLAPR